MSNTIELRDYGACERALREPDLKQALYDEGAILMKRVLVTLHGDEHRARRVLEMRVFRRDLFRQHEQVVINQGHLDDTIKRETWDSYPIRFDPELA